MTYETTTIEENNDFGVYAVQGAERVKVFLPAHEKMDSLGVPSFRPAYGTSIKPEDTCVIDADCLTKLDASGVGMLMSWYRQAQAAGGKVMIAGLKGQPRELFRLMGLERDFDLQPNIETAIEKAQTRN